MGTQIRLSKSRLAVLKEMTRQKGVLLDVGERSQLQFCFRTGVCPVSLLEAIRDKLLDDSALQYLDHIQEWLDDVDIVVPPPQPAPRNPELEARIQRLKREQENRQYREMTKNIDPVRFTTNVKSVSTDLRAVNRQILIIVNMLLTVAGAFAFGYKGLDLIIYGLSFGTRLILGCIFATIVFFADLYFIIKTLEMDEPEHEKTS